jgi:thioesterase domain-containing protein
MPQFETLMPIRTKGSLPPLFCVHGQPLRMAQRLNRDRPVYGLSHVYHSDFLESRPESMEALAATYLDEVRQVRPHGPYHLCGFSAGGLVAFEMARQLLAAGETIGSLTLVEPTVSYRKSSVGGSVARLRSEAGGRAGFLLRLTRKAPRAVWARLRLLWRKLVTRLYLLVGRPLPEDLRWLGYLHSLGPAMSRYYYEPLDCEATVLYGQLGDEYREYYQGLWDTLLTGRGRFVVFEDVREHVDFMVDPALSRTVELIESAAA